MSIVTHAVESNFHYLGFPANIDHKVYEEIFSEIYQSLGSLQDMKLIADLSLVEHVNSGFIGMLSELYSLLEEVNGKMIVITNTAIDDMFRLVGFDDYVQLVSTKEEAVNLLG